MNEAFFFCQKSYGNTTRFNFFYTDFFLSVRAPGIFGPTDQKIFQYDRRPCYMIWSDWKILIFDKSLMGTKLESIFLSTKMYLNYSPWPRDVPKWKFALIRLKTFLYANFWMREFLFVKTLMGIQWFKVHFRAIFSSFHYIWSSTQASHQKSLNIYLRTLYSVYNDMHQDFFFVKIPMGTPLDSFFLHSFFSVRVSGPGRYPNENLFLYDQRSSYMILLK